MFANVNDLILYIEKSKRQEKKTSLDGMFSYLRLFGNPHEGIPYIHIGGTNGKGSTVTYLKNILMESGRNVGAYISPYVLKFNERIGYNNTYIKDEDLLRIGNLIKNKVEDMNLPVPPFFDFVTLIAFIYYKELYNKGLLDIVILEVGMGGIFDSTNVVYPLCSAITNVTPDHLAILGPTIKDIWVNKLGILKKDIPFVTYKSEYLDLVYEKNKESRDNSNLYILDKDDIFDLNVTMKDTSFKLKDYDTIHLSKLGKYQAENAYIAIKIIEILNNIYNYNISKDNIYKGLANSFWPGRLEIVSNDPLIILDGAHNIDAILRLKEFIEEIKFSHPLRLVIAISSNKECEKMIKAIEGLAQEVVFTQFSYTRSSEAKTLYEYSDHPNKVLMEDVNECVNYILKDKSHDNILFGSLYFVSEVRNKFDKQ